MTCPSYTCHKTYVKSITLSISLDINTDYVIPLLEPKSIWFYILILKSKSRIKCLVTCYKGVRTQGVGRYRGFGKGAEGSVLELLHSVIETTVYSAIWGDQIYGYDKGIHPASLITHSHPHIHKIESRLGSNISLIN